MFFTAQPQEDALVFSPLWPGFFFCFFAGQNKRQSGVKNQRAQLGRKPKVKRLQGRSAYAPGLPAFPRLNQGD
jgi:hypothetical protein